MLAWWVYHTTICTFLLRCQASSTPSSSSAGWGHHGGLRDNKYPRGHTQEIHIITSKSHLLMSDGAKNKKIGAPFQTRLPNCHVPADGRIMATVFLSHRSLIVVSVYASYARLPGGYYHTTISTFLLTCQASRSPSSPFTGWSHHGGLCDFRRALR